MSLHPIIKWAQRKDKIFLEVGIRDIINEKFDMKDKSIQFSCESQGKKYQFKTQFFADVNPQTSKWTKTGFHLLVSISKKQTNKPFWPRLTASSGKSPYIQCDWDKWVDQDQEEQSMNKGLAGFDQNNMQNFNDSDDEQQQNKGNIDDLDEDKPIIEDPTGSSA